MHPCGQIPLICQLFSWVFFRWFSPSFILYVRRQEINLACKLQRQEYHITSSSSLSEALQKSQPRCLFNKSHTQDGKYFTTFSYHTVIFILKIMLESSSKEAFERNSHHDVCDEGLAGITTYFSSFYCEKLYAFKKVLVDKRQWLERLNKGNLSDLITEWWVFNKIK